MLYPPLFYLRSEDKGYLESSGEEGGPVKLLPWREKSCRKNQLLLWRKEEDRLIDEKGLALSLSGEYTRWTGQIF